ncbi:hypothetical protein V5799_032104 [Amblyomma americanum]|uniref:SAM domain-containing protein n=1 Tax=Amblyomma americanum TaxID=6943 RepID=A0AAQ4DS28_AMBAM
MSRKATLRNVAGNVGPGSVAASRGGQQPQVTMLPLLRHVPGRPMAMPNAVTHVIDDYVIYESLEPFSISYMANALDDERTGLPVGLELPSAVAPPPVSRELPNLAPARTATPAAKKTESKPIPVTNPTLDPVLSQLMALAASLSQNQTLATENQNPVVIPVPAPPLIPIPITRTTAKQTPRVRVLGRRHVPTSRRPPLLRIKPPSSWTVDEVAHYIQRLPGCAKYAEAFREQLIDGEALFLLNEHHLMKAMSLKLGPAVKICAVIRSLRENL